MAKIAYLECPTGIAGDMCLGALMDLGVPLAYLTDQLERLGISREYQLQVEQVHRNGQRATKFHVELLDDSGAPVDPESSTTFDHSAHRHPIHSATEALVSVSTGDSYAHMRPDHLHQSHADHQEHRVGATGDLGDEKLNSLDTLHEHPQISIRHLPEIERLILLAKLPARAEAWSLAVFRKLAAAEGAVHGIPPEQVHFHEVGATDAIVDIIGTCLGLDWLGVDQLYCSALPVGGGTFRAAHGRLPAPAPAVLKLFEMRHVPIYSNGIERELVTPTGAAIATTLATQFGQPPAMVLHRVGLGAGSRNLPLPNILRLWIGEGIEGDGEVGSGGVRGDTGMGRRGLRRERSAERDAGKEVVPSAPSPQTSHLSPETVAVLETQIDDLNPQAIGYVFEVLLAAGALDVFTQSIAMKKSRSGVLLTVICHPDDTAACETVIFRETTTLGIRRSLQQRQILQREIQSVQTEYGTVRVKVAWAKGNLNKAAQNENCSPTNIQPEYEDCAQIARQKNLPWREIHRAALHSWYRERRKYEG